MQYTLAHHTCYALARAFSVPPLKSFGFRAPTITQWETSQRYLDNRISKVDEYRSLFSPFVTFKDKTVLELGCSRGYLLDSFLSHEPFHAIGVDTNAEQLMLGKQQYGDRIRFIQGTPATIPVPSSSVDIVYTIDTVEHLSQPREIFSEIARILKPDGRALIHFGPFRNPYGSHMEDIIPFPWPHVLFSMETLLGVAARLYDSSAYSAAWFFIDEKTGQKKSNPYRDTAFWDEFLNHMSIRQFNRLCEELPLRKIHQDRIGFGGKRFKIGRLVKRLARVPLLDDFFCNALYTVLEKPNSGAAQPHGNARED